MKHSIVNEIKIISSEVDDGGITSEELVTLYVNLIQSRLDSRLHRFSCHSVGLRSRTWCINSRTDSVLKHRKWFPCTK